MSARGGCDGAGVGAPWPARPPKGPSSSMPMPTAASFKRRPTSCPRSTSTASDGIPCHGADGPRARQFQGRSAPTRNIPPGAWTGTPRHLRDRAASGPARPCRYSRSVEPPNDRTRAFSRPGTASRPPDRGVGSSPPEVAGFPNQFITNPVGATYAANARRFFCPTLGRWSESAPPDP